MAEIEGGLLKSVLHLAACSDKLRSADARLGKYVEGMRRDLPAAAMPSLKSKLAIVPAGSTSETDTPEEQFQKLYDQGTEATERLELAKARMEKELRRRSEHFRELVSSRNTDIQEEYARMLKELEDQAEELKKARERERSEIENERAVKRANSKRRREEREERRARKKYRAASLSTENALAQEQLEAYTAEIRQLQTVFAAMEEEDEEAAREEEENARTEQERLEHLESQLQAEATELRREIAMLKEARDSINAKLETSSLKSQYEEEREEVNDEIAHLRDVLEGLTTQISSNGVRLHSLLRTLAPTPSIGTLMTRLFQQLSPDMASASGSPSRDSADSSATVTRKTVDLQEFLHSCPTVDEGQRAIDEMKKLQLIHYYASSGVIALAE